MSCKVKNCVRKVISVENGEEYCRVHSPARQRQYRIDNPERSKSYTLQRDYGISLGEYEELMRRQNGCCAICKRADGDERNNNNGSKRLSVDHDHKTGAIRGLLCTMCNQGIGALQDSTTLLKLAIEYLEKFTDMKDVSSAAVDRLLDELMNDSQSETPK